MAVDEATVQKIHSAVRWGKSVDEIKAVLNDDAKLNEALNAPDVSGNKTMNCAIHIACQNGHLDLTKWLIEVMKVDINAQNAKGNTGLHMSVGYDFYDQTDFLISAGADKELKNAEGNTAVTGIDGDKKGSEGVGGGYYKFQSAKTKEQLLAALEKLEREGKDDLPGKVPLAQAKMAKTKSELVKNDPALKEELNNRMKEIMSKCE